ncbi:MAG TPA: glutaredoxin family protein [Chloroflexota bacterium]|nr:glutaredoxin family protein [Chloroflexota bacterium]
MRLHATLYMKAECHLCEATRADLERLQKRHPHTLELVDITTDQELLRRYGERIPVLQVGADEYAAPLGPAVLERALRQAATEQAQASERRARHG